MSQTSESFTADESPVKETPTLLSNSTTENDSSQDLFSEVLHSGKELEGLFGKQKREDMHGKKSSKKKGANGLKDPLSLMKERVEIYNKKMESEYQFTVNEEVCYE